MDNDVPGSTNDHQEAGVIHCLGVSVSITVFIAESPLDRGASHGLAGDTAPYQTPLPKGDHSHPSYHYNHLSSPPAHARADLLPT